MLINVINVNYYNDVININNFDKVSNINSVSFTDKYIFSPKLKL